MARLFVRVLRTGALLAALCGTTVVAAQDSRSNGGVRAVGQASKPTTLNEALSRLATRPQDIDALLEASNAALQLGDIEAAIGFLTRADAVSPGNPRVKGMIGSALVRNENPYDAIGYFDQAEAAGADVAKLASDRGLAYDLVGDQATAQSFYRIAMARTPSEELTRRYALSLAVGGDKRTADQVLSPLIQRQDPAAWRTRTFILAITGNEEEAISIANSMMPKHLANGIAPYLRYMPRLTSAQQIAAATFGKFPRAADIGRDDPRAARFVKTSPRGAGTQIALAPSAAAKSSAATGAKSAAPATKPVAAKAPVTSPVVPARVAPPSVDPAIRPSGTNAAANEQAVSPAGPARAAPGTMSAPAAVATAAPAQASAPTQQPAMVADADPGSAAAPSAPSLNASATSPTQVAGPVEPSVPPSTNAPAFDFSSAFGDFRPPAEEQRQIAAVDISRVPPASARSVAAKPAEKPAPKAAVKPVEEKSSKPPAGAATSAKMTRGATVTTAAEASSKGAKVKTDKVDPKAAKADPKGAKADTKNAKTAAADKASAKGKKGKEARNPSRVWVQLSTGGNKDDLPKDWRRISAKAGTVLRGKKAFIAEWRNNFRLLTGPFPTDAAAQTFVNQLRREGVSAFSWSSEDGQAVDALATGK